MKWGKFLAVRPKRFTMWAALCTGRAERSTPKYLAGEKHAILVMVLAPEPDVEAAIYSLLQSNGWRELEIKKLKMLDEPFHSDDPIMQACHENAILKEGGFVVYTDPIEEP
jgi:hypothetical protein